jgi:hypothetical protein
VATAKKEEPVLSDHELRIKETFHTAKGPIVIPSGHFAWARLKGYPW